MTSSGACIGLSLAQLRRARCIRPSLPGLTGQSIGLSQNSYALWKKALRPDERLARAIIPRRCPVEETAAPERRSTRSFGEYAFLEDSRYASQMKNVSVLNSIVSL